MQHPSGTFDRPFQFFSITKSLAPLSLHLLLYLGLLIFILMNKVQRRKFLKALFASGWLVALGNILSGKAFGFTAPHLRVKRKTFWCFWGSNLYGQFGNGTSGGSSSTPIAALAGTDWESIVGGLDHTILRKSNGEIWSTGRNNWGQLGIGNLTNKSVPTRIGSSTAWTSLAGSFGPFNAALQGSSLYDWGQNPDGNIGNGTVGNAISTPILVTSSGSFLSLGDYHGIGVMADGSLWGWGDASSGQIGSGTTSDQSWPNSVQGGSTFLKVAAGHGSSYAIRSDGTLWAWGANGSGQLGNGVASAVKVSTPIKIGTLTTWVDIKAAGSTVFAKKNDGTYWCWGYNDEGELGMGDVASRSTPVQFSGTTWSQILPSYGFVLGLKTDGSLYTWGAGAGGVLGTGSTANASTPVQVPGRWQKIFVTQTHAGGLRL